MSTVVSNAGASRRSTDGALWLGFGVVALACLAWLFRAGIWAVVVGWSKPEYSHGWLIPAVTLFLLWQRRQRILAARDGGAWAGTVLVGASMLLLLLLSAGHMQIPEAATLVVALGGVGLAALGRPAMRWVWVPVLFLLFALPVPQTAYYILATKLQLVSSVLGAEMLRLAGVSVFVEGNVIDLGSMQLQVAEACSGLRYLFPLAAFGFLCAWLYKAPWWARVTVFLATAPITIFMNSLRIAMTGLLVEYGDPELAEGFMHLFEGWVIFLGALALLLALMWLLAKLAGQREGALGLLDFDRMSGGSGPVPAMGRTSAPGMPALVALGCMVATMPVQAWIGNWDEVVPPRPGLVTFPLQLGDWRGAPQPMDPEILEILRADDHLLVDFARSGDGAPVNLWIAYYGRQTAGGWIHSPNACLPGAGWEFVELGDIPAPVTGADGRPFAVKRAVVANGQQRILMYYWFEQRGNRFTDEMWSKVYNLIDAFTLHRSDGALVRILTPIEPGDTVDAAEARVRDLMVAAYPYIEPHVGR